MSLSSISALNIDKRPETYLSFLKALVHYIKNYYLSALKSAHHHILYVIPMLKAGNYQLKWFKFGTTSFAHGYEGLTSEGFCGPYRELFARNAIAIVGVRDDRKSPENYPSTMNQIGCIGRETPLGVVYLSRRVFVETIILQNLEGINRRTTVIPSPASFLNQKMQLKLCAWDSQRTRCERVIDDESNVRDLQYKWFNEEDLTHGRENSVDNHRYHWSINCMFILILLQAQCSLFTGLSSNKVSFPVSPGQDYNCISIKGECHVTFKYKNRSIPQISKYPMLLNLRPRY